MVVCIHSVPFTLCRYRKAEAKFLAMRKRATRAARYIPVEQLREALKNHQGDAPRDRSDDEYVDDTPRENDDSDADAEKTPPSR